MVISLAAPGIGRGLAGVRLLAKCVLNHFLTYPADGLHRIQTLGAHPSAVPNTTTTKEAVRIFQQGQTFGRAIVARVGDKPV